MKINKLKLVNFRNYDKLEIQLGKNMNFFIGKNAQGKTNILESIIFLALTKSHRLGVFSNIIQYNKKKAKINAIINKEEYINKVELEVTETNKSMIVNNNKVIKVADYISNLNIIIFTPDDLEIIKGTPNIRRNLLNIQLSQLSKEYLKTYNEYNKILKNRNEYLKILYVNSIADKSYLDIITDKLIEKAIIIYQKRNEYINLINENISNIYLNITNDKDIKVKYIPNIKIESFETEKIKEILIETFKKSYNREINNKMTLFGPHRDDISFILDGIDLKYYGSQGQQKSAILAFKLSEIPIFTEINKTKPVLLLDDIFSELDIEKRKNLLKIISDDLQCIITTTDLKNISKRYLEKANIYEINNGKIKKVGKYER